MSILFSRAQIVALFAIMLQNDVDSTVEVLDKDNYGEIRIQISNSFSSIDYLLHENGGWSLAPLTVVA